MPETYPYEDEFGDSYDSGGGNNAIRDADRALFPDGTNPLMVLMKARVDANLKPQLDHILSVQLRRGAFDAILGPGAGKGLDAFGALAIVDQFSSIGLGGLAREEIIDAFEALPTMQRHMRRPGASAEAGF